MTFPPSDDPNRIFDTTPYLKLVIDKEGRWYQNDAEIIHPEIYVFFNQALEKTSDGGYQIRVGREICRVEVEDAPFVIRSVLETDDGQLLLVLNDSTMEPFKPECFWIGGRNIPYTEVKKGAFHARFLRPAYYQLAKYIVNDEEGMEFYFAIGGRKIPVKMLGD